MIIKSPVFKWHSNNGPFSNWTTFDHLNTRLVRYSDPPLYDKYGTLSIQIEQNGIKKFCLQGDKGRGGQISCCAPGAFSSRYGPVRRYSRNTEYTPVEQNKYKKHKIDPMETTIGT